MTLIAITGSTGRLGHRVARLLETAEIRQRLIVRDSARAPSLRGAEVAAAGYGDLDAMTAALAGAQRVLMVSAAETPERVAQHRTFVDAAVAAGVEHLVYTSFFGASATATFTLARDHWDTEEYVKASGLAYTFLRDNVYADVLPFLAGDDGVLRGPAGTGRVAAVAQQDIAEVAALILQRPDAHTGRTYDLTGPEALNLREVADVLTRAAGRSVGYESGSVDQAYASRRAAGVSQWQLDAWVSTYTAIAAGELDGVTDDVASITGHPPISLADLLRARA